MKNRHRMYFMPAVLMLALQLTGCGSIPRQSMWPHVTPRGVVIKNFHAELDAREQAQRSATRPPWWPGTRP